MMNMSGTGGYILHAFKMYVIFPFYIPPFQHFRSFDDPDAQAILIHRQKKRKLEKPVGAQEATESAGEDVRMSEELTEYKQTS